MNPYGRLGVEYGPISGWAAANISRINGEITESGALKGLQELEKEVDIRGNYSLEMTRMARLGSYQPRTKKCRIYWNMIACDPMISFRHIFYHEHGHWLEYNRMPRTLAEPFLQLKRFNLTPYVQRIRNFPERYKRRCRQGIDNVLASEVFAEFWGLYNGGVCAHNLEALDKVFRHVGKTGILDWAKLSLADSDQAADQSGIFSSPHA